MFLNTEILGGVALAIWLGGNTNEDRDLDGSGSEGSCQRPELIHGPPVSFIVVVTAANNPEKAEARDLPL